MAEIDHSLGTQPQITIDGRAFYIRSESPEHVPVNKVVNSRYTIGSGGVRRRLVAIMPREWVYTIACRGVPDRDYILNLVNNMTESNAVHTFYDGASGATYNVTVLEVGTPVPVMDNFEYWDIEVKLAEIRSGEWS